MSALPEPSTICFPDGLVGFSGPQRFALDPWGGEDSPFSLLRSLDDPALAFVVVPPKLFFSDYEPELPADVLSRLGLDEAAGAVLLAIVTVPDDPREATANLLGPLVLNPETLVGVQAVLNPERWPSRRRLVEPVTSAA